MSPDKLVYMANQIGKFFASQGEDKAVPQIADHLVKFWDPRMRMAIVAYLAAGGAGLDAPVRKAVEDLAAQPRKNDLSGSGSGTVASNIRA
jgi:formate dehydrogenase subunit delta